MDFERLRSFYIVAREKSISRAAGIVGLSQPAITRQIQSLEDAVGVRLLNRHARRGIVLTSKGELFFERTKQVLSEIDSLSTCLHADRKPEGKLLISCNHGSASLWLTRLLPGFMKDYPDVHVQILCTDEEMDFKMQRSDVALTSYVSSEQTDLVSIFLAKIHLKVYANTQYLKKFGTPGKAEDLDQHRILSFGGMPNQDIRFIDWLLWEGASDGKIRTPYLQVNSNVALYEAANRGMGIVALSQMTQIPSDTKLVNILPDLKSPEVNYYCVYPKNNEDMPNVKAFKSYLQKVAAEEL